MRRAAAIVALLAIASLVSASRAQAAKGIAGGDLARQLRHGPVTLTGVRVGGDVDLSGQTVKHPFSCRSCTFSGAVTARGTTFEHIVDLRGSTLAHANFSEAIFQAPALFGSPSRSAHMTFARNVDFSLATFHDLATFQWAVFKLGADFRLARFGAGATFSHGKATRRADFTRASFQGAADFSDYSFCGAAVFGGVEFAGPADFSKADFEASATFVRARLAKGATFLTATFPVNPSATDSFAELHADGDLNFSFASLAREVDFEDMTATGAISFRDAKLTAKRSLVFEDVSAGGLDMSVGAAANAVQEEDLPGVLAMIESSAKDRGDLGVANDAHYERRVLESRTDSWPVRVLDVVFYRTIAGYLVRPLQPLAALLLLAALMTAVHVGRRAWPHPAPVHGRGWRGVRLQYRRALRFVSPLGDAYLQTLALVVPGRGPSADERAARRIEVFAYRLLFVCALIGLANSNPTLRQMFDAIR